MNQQEKKSFPIIAALLASKALKQISAGDSRDPMPSFVIKGHESMSVTLHIESKIGAGFWLECEADFLASHKMETEAVVDFFATTFESTEDFAREHLAKLLPAFASNFIS